MPNAKFFWNPPDRMEVHVSLFDPVRRPDKNSICRVCERVNFPLRDGGDVLKTIIPDDKFWLFKTEQPCEHAGSIIRIVPDGLGADSNSRSRSELFQCV